jgi:hypothetical protein
MPCETSEFIKIRKVQSCPTSEEEAHVDDREDAGRTPGLLDGATVVAFVDPTLYRRAPALRTIFRNSVYRR